jgi:hypothetical protein
LVFLILENIFLPS